METGRTVLRSAVAAIIAIQMIGCAAQPKPYPTLVDTLAGPPALVNAANPAIQAAAKIKMDKCLKLEKIKSLKYLGKVGCGCKGKEFKVSEALLAGMADCDEDVRKAAVDAVCKTISNSQCEVCNKNGCCNIAISAKLYEMAYKTDEQGCPLEPSEELRMAAAEVYCMCPLYQPGMKIEPEKPIGPEREGPPTVPPEVPASPEPPSALELGRDGDSVSTASAQTQSYVAAARVRPQYSIQPIAVSKSIVTVAIPLPPEEGIPASGEPLPSHGIIRSVDAAYGTARIEFEGSAMVPRGTRLVICQRHTRGGVVTAGQLEVISSTGGSATVRPVGTFRLNPSMRGDEVTVLGG